VYFGFAETRSDGSVGRLNCLLLKLGCRLLARGFVRSSNAHSQMTDQIGWWPVSSTKVRSKKRFRR
jgi:hypothetical protein